MDVFNALRIAIRSEMGAQRMYARLAQETSDAKAKALFNYLAKYESMHQRFLESERSALTAIQEDGRGRPSHWLGLLEEELDSGIYEADDAMGSDLAKMKLELYAAQGIAEILKDANTELSQRQARYEHELAIAADVQRKLLPQESPRNIGLQIAASNIMARSVGGDYYDFIVNQQGQMALIVADSMGKGMPAALLMTTVRAIWRSFSETGDRLPGQTLEMINKAVYPDLSATESFVTMFMCLYDPSSSTFQYSGAGHNPPIFYSRADSACHDLDVGGTPIGLFPDSEYPGTEFAIGEGDFIVIYTDGVVEATDESNKPFGVEKLCDVVNQIRNADAENINKAILSEVDSYTHGASQADDITVVVLKKAEIT